MGVTKQNVCIRTIITSVAQAMVPGEQKFTCMVDDFYILDITSKKNGERLFIWMRSPDGYNAKEMVPPRFYAPPVLSEGQLIKQSRSFNGRIYAGKMDYRGHSVNELILLTLPNGLGKGQTVTAHWQWKVDGAGREKFSCINKDEQRHSEGNTFLTSFYPNSGFTPSNALSATI